MCTNASKPKPSSVDKGLSRLRETHACKSVHSVPDRLEWALGICRKLKVRPTPIRQALLEFLAAQRVPVRLQTVVSAPGISGRFDAATAYRTLMLFHETEVIRQVGLPEKARFFVLNAPGDNYHFLICKTCGSITELPAGDHCQSLEHDVAATHGFVQLYHELQFFGICPECQKKPSRTMCVKLPVTGHKHARLHPAAKPPSTTLEFLPPIQHARR